MVMLVELQATCSALGYQEGKKYVKEPDCLGMIFNLRFTVQLDYTVIDILNLLLQQNLKYHCLTCLTIY